MIFEQFSSTIVHFEHGSNGNGYKQWLDEYRPNYENLDDTAIVDLVLRANAYGVEMKTKVKLVNHRHKSTQHQTQMP